MTITSVQSLLPGRIASNSAEKQTEKPPPQLHGITDFPFKGYHPPQPEGYQQSQAHPDTSAIVIDNGKSINTQTAGSPSELTANKCATCTGSHLVKAGWSFDKNPRFAIPPVMSRYRDRKLNRQCQFIGYDAYVDATTRGQLRNGFDPGSSVVGNWDVMEGVLDYLFLKLGVDGANGGVGRPILMTEPIANMGYSRKSECMPASAVIPANFSSDERNPLRMLLRALGGLRCRLPLLISLQWRQGWFNRGLLAHVYSCHPRDELETYILQQLPSQLGWLTGLRIFDEAHEAQVPDLPHSLDRRAHGGDGP